VGAIAGGFVLFVNRAEKKSEKKTMKEVKDWKENN
jgi:hypothetical protein